MGELSPSEALGAGPLLRGVAQLQIFCRATSATMLATLVAISTCPQLFRRSWARCFSPWGRGEAGDVADITLYRVGFAGDYFGTGDLRRRLREWASAAWRAFKCVSDAEPPGRGDRY